MPNLYENEKYTVEKTQDAVGEDGEYGADGYKVINKETGVSEMTTMVLPSAIYHANHFNDMLKSLTEEAPEADLSEVNFPDDVVPN